MRKALFIADYGKDTGSGHLMRSAALAKELSSDFEVTFIYEKSEYIPFITEVVERSGAKIETISDVWHVNNELEADVLILDSYKSNMTFLTSIKNSYDVCVVVDDNNMLPFYDTDIIINQNIGSEELEYRVRKDTCLLLGTKYLMLPEQFVNRQPININDDVKRIAVTMGGVDIKNATEKILNLLSRHPEYTYDIVIGPCFMNQERLKRYESDNVVLHYSPNMPTLLGQCQAAIASCGTTIYELAALGIPTMGIVTADNQKAASISMEKSGIIFCAGLEEKLSDAYFDILFEDITTNKESRLTMHNNQINAICKDGVKHIKECILSKLQ